MKLPTITISKTSEETAFVTSCFICKLIVSSHSFSISACENIPLIFAYASALTHTMYIYPTPQGNNWHLCFFNMPNSLSGKKSSHSITWVFRTLIYIQVMKRQEHPQICLKRYSNNFLKTLFEQKKKEKQNSLFLSNSTKQKYFKKLHIYTYCSKLFHIEPRVINVTKNICKLKRIQLKIKDDTFTVPKYTHRKIAVNVHIISNDLALSLIVNFPKSSSRLPGRNFSLQNTIFIIFGILYLKHMSTFPIKYPIFPYYWQSMKS